MYSLPRTIFCDVWFDKDDKTKVDHTIDQLQWYRRAIYNVLGEEQIEEKYYCSTDEKNGESPFYWDIPKDVGDYTGDSQNDLEDDLERVSKELSQTRRNLRMSGIRFELPGYISLIVNGDGLNKVDVYLAKALCPSEGGMYGGDSKLYQLLSYDGDSKAKEIFDFRIGIEGRVKKEEYEELYKLMFPKGIEIKELGKIFSTEVLPFSKQPLPRPLVGNYPLNGLREYIVYTNFGSNYIKVTADRRQENRIGSKCTVDYFNKYSGSNGEINLLTLERISDDELNMWNLEEAVKGRKSAQIFTL